jgi:hypothetical protein
MELINALIETQKITNSYFELPESDLKKRYGPNNWTVREVLIHLADAESILHQRIKRIIAEPKQVIWAFNQDHWCENLEYSAMPIELAKSLYLVNRNGVIYLVNKYLDLFGDKEFIHSETGKRTLRDEMEKVANHNQAHINQIKKALEK